jgi:hypothetical protein
VGARHANGRGRYVVLGSSLGRTAVRPIGTTISPFSLIGSIQIVVLGNDDNIRETIDNLRIASENLAQLTDHVNHQPWSLSGSGSPNDGRVTTTAFCSHQCVNVSLEVCIVREFDRHRLPLPLEDRTFQCVLDFALPSRPEPL